MTLPLASPPPRPPVPGELSLLRRARPVVLAREELLSLPPALAELVGTPGLRRGSTLAVAASPAPGATSLALALLAGPSGAGSWCAVVGLPELGLLAAGELGVDLERLVVVPAPGPRFAAVTAALLEGCDLVLARLPPGLGAAEARRLSARARERRAVLLLAAPGLGGPVPSRRREPPWTERPEVELAVLAAAFGGPERGDGPPGELRLGALRLEVAARRRRAAPEQVQGTLLLPHPGLGGGRAAPAFLPGRPAPEPPAREARWTATR